MMFNEFTAIPGGTDEVVKMEVGLLKASDIEIKLFSFKNSDLLASSIFNRIRTAACSICGTRFRDMIQNEIDNYKPDIIHFHNLYQIFRSPVWNDINPGKAKIILHIHNYYPFCLNSLMYRKGFCKECFIRNSWLPGIFHKCYNNSFSLSLLTAINRLSPLSWLRDIKKVDRIIVISQFLYDKLVELGVSESQISIVRNSTAVHEVTAPGNFVLYLGNIAGEKGIHTFCEAAAELPFLSFIAAGDGRELLHLKKKYSAIKNLNFKGYADPFTRTKLLSECRFLYFPTRCMETFGMVILEAFSYGKPVLTTGSGATGELVISGKTGEINSSKNFKSQADSVINLWNKLDNNDEYSKNCLETARKYSPANHLRQLEEIYYNL